MNAELVLDAKALLGEGSLWDPERKVLYWIDILGQEIHIYNPEDGEDSIYSLTQPVGTLVKRKKGGLVLALQDGIYSFDYCTGVIELMVALEKEIPENRLNDGKCDPEGRLWVGSVSYNCDIPEVGSLYRIDAELKPVKVLDKLTIANGICWASEKNEMYYIDSPTREIWQFAYDPASGRLSNKSVVVSIPVEEGIPDGMTIDRNDNLWVAHFGGGRVCCYASSNGEKISEILLPVSNVTSCAFGGSDFSELYITTARIGLGQKELEQQTNAGGLFMAKPGVQGVPAPSFIG
jgi:sugar lactone lactonase YvrE